MIEPKIFAIDFDGTIVTHAYPDIGLDIGAIKVLKRIQSSGHKIILFTMRSGDFLEDAVRYLESKGIQLYGVNENPEQHEWTSSPKPYAHFYIDDTALGCPVTKSVLSSRAYVKWTEVERMLEAKGLLK